MHDRTKDPHVLHRTYQCRCGAMTSTSQSSDIAYSYGDTFYCGRCQRVEAHQLVEVRTEWAENE